MKVKELIAELANFDPEREVWLGYEYGLLGHQISVSNELAILTTDEKSIDGHRLIEEGDNPKPDDERRIVVIWEDIDA